MRRKPVALGICILALWTVAAGPDPVRVWNDEIDRIDALLQEGRWKKAGKAARSLREEMFEGIIAGGRELLGRLAALEAVALAGQGEMERARWTWAIARHFYPTLDAVVLDKYGEAGTALKVAPAQPTWDADRSAGEGAATEVERPEVVHQHKPRFPRARVGLARSVAIVVECVVGTDGVPRHPTVVRAEGEETMVYSALMALGQWRFEPARLHGEPVSVFYNLTVNFKTWRDE